MSSKRLYLILAGVICLLMVGLLAGTYGANKLLSSRAATLTNLKAKTKAQALQQDSLRKAKKDIEKYSDLQKIAQAVVPEDKNQAQAVRQIVNIAEANGISLASVTFPASTLGNSGAKSSTSATATTPPPSPNSPATRLSQLTPVKGIPGVYELAITIQNDSNSAVPYSKFISFLSDLEQDRRTAQVSNISLQPLATNRNLLVFSLSLTEYIKP